MNGRRRSSWLRPLGWGVVVGLLFLSAGDRGATAPPPGIGIDPFDVLDLQIKNNVLIVLDTSGSMKWPADIDNYSLGGDDPASRLFQAKAAIRAVVNANQTRMNFGLATYNVLDNQKTLNQNQDFEGDGDTDGPFVYVSADGQAAPFHGLHTSIAEGASAACNAVDGFFCGIDNDFADYDGANSGDVFRSFMNRGGGANPVNIAYDDPYPAGCTSIVGPTPVPLPPPAPPTPGSQLSPVDVSVPATMRCRYYMQSRLLRNNQRYTWNRATGTPSLRLVTTAAIPGGCPVPPAGLLGYNAAPPICFQHQDGVGGPIATYYYSSSIFQLQAGNACGGGAAINNVSPCSGNNAPAIGLRMDPELPVSTTGTLPDLAGAFTVANFLNGDNPVVRGLRADQSTPLGGTLNFVRTAAPVPVFPPNTPPAGDPRQKNFVILLTDGDDTCEGGNNDQNAVAAAVDAQALYGQGGYNPVTNATADPQHRAETFVVAFATAVNVGRANIIAQGGSGAFITAGGPVTQPTGSPANAGCNRPGVTCRNAFTAQTTQQLINVLNQALAISVSGGEFSTVQSVFDGVFEFEPVADVLNPDPLIRYPTAVNAIYRTTFTMPGFQGEVAAFGNTLFWQAGQKLMARLQNDLVGVTATPPGAEITFAGLHGGLVAGPARPGPNAKIDRRIFTTVTNGVAPTEVMLWPPQTTVAPPDYTTPGILDDILGIGPGSGPPPLLQVQLSAAPLRACVGTNLPPQCVPPPAGTATAAQILAASRREAREMILAFVAGAIPRPDVNGDPQRDPVSRQIQYRRRAWLLSETTLGVSALVTPPFQDPPAVHTSEYLLYRDGPRIASGPLAGQAPLTCPASGGPCLLEGFGLRNPDNDGREVPPTVRPTLKPVMSVVYVPANDMLHAFRAGPCPASGVPAALCTPPANGGSIPPAPPNGPVETGGEELWGFVPYDLLPKLRRRLETQSRDDHTFMLGNSLRFGEVFVPSSTPFTIEGRPYTGRWRRILVVGRGLGAQTTVDTTTPKPAMGGAFGKYYTVLDITAPGPFTQGSLDMQLPDVLWNRGNPDFRALNDPTPNGTPADATAYATMGQTWSVPSLSRVEPSFNGREYVLSMGSGYPEVPSEGSTFYTLDPLTGEVLATADVGDGVPVFNPEFENAIVAGPVVYTPELFVSGSRPHPAGVATLGTYVGDIHGRMWKFAPANPGTPIAFGDFGRTQPVGVAGAMFNLNTPTSPGLAAVFISTGHDARVPETGPPFQLWGLDDTGSVPAPARPGFPKNLPPRFRGTIQPVTTINFAGQAAFFAATRFNPAITQCVSSFDTVVFGINVVTGGAAYDLDPLTGGTNESVTFTNVKAVGMPRPPTAAGQELQALSQGVPGATGTLPTPTPPPIPPPTGTPTVSVRSLSFNSSVCR